MFGEVGGGGSMFQEVGVCVIEVTHLNDTVRLVQEPLKYFI